MTDNGIQNDQWDLPHLPLDKMSPFRRRHLVNAFSWISPKSVAKGPIDRKVSIGSGNGLAPNKRQAITWTNADLIHWRIYAALGEDELTK